MSNEVLEALKSIIELDKEILKEYRNLLISDKDENSQYKFDKYLLKLRTTINLENSLYEKVAVDKETVKKALDFFSKNAYNPYSLYNKLADIYNNDKNSMLVTRIVEKLSYILFSLSCNNEEEMDYDEDYDSNYDYEEDNLIKLRKCIYEDYINTVYYYVNDFIKNLDSEDSKFFLYKAKYYLLYMLPTLESDFLKDNISKDNLFSYSQFFKELLSVSEVEYNKCCCDECGEEFSNASIKLLEDFGNETINEELLTMYSLIIIGSTTYLASDDVEEILIRVEGINELKDIKIPSYYRDLLNNVDNYKNELKIVRYKN